MNLVTLKCLVRKILLTIILTTGFLGLAPATVRAAIVEETIDRTYVAASDHVKVTESLTSTITDSRYLLPGGAEEIFLVFNPIIDDSNAQEKIDKTLPTIKVTDAAGTAQQFTTEIDGQNIKVKFRRPSSLLFGQTQTYSITYDSYALMGISGATRDLYLPTFAKDFVFTSDTTNLTYRTKIIIPKELGEINFVAPQKPITQTETTQEIEFTQAELVDTIAWVQIGTKQFYEFAITQSYSATNNTPIFHNTYLVTLPRDVDAGPLSQDVIFTEISPSPDSIYLDENGNLIGKFIIPSSQSGEIVVRGYTTVTNDKSIDSQDSGLISGIPKELTDLYTKPGEYWEVDNPEIQKVALELKGDETNVFKIAQKTYEFVIGKIDYSDVKRFGINERQGALKTLQGGAAVCMEYSDLYITLMRAQGIPARAAFGYGYDARSTNGIDTAHQWAEIYIPKLNQWIPVDTTWGESGPNLIGGDLNHFYKYVAAIDPETPSPVEVSFFGQSPEVKQEEFTITALASLPENTSGQTQSDLLAKFPPKSPIQQAAENIVRTFGSVIGFGDQKLDSFMQNRGISSPVLQIIKTILYSIPFILILVLVLKKTSFASRTRLVLSNLLNRTRIKNAQQAQE